MKKVVLVESLIVGLSSGFSSSIRTSKSLAKAKKYFDTGCKLGNPDSCGR